MSLGIVFYFVVLVVCELLQLTLKKILNGNILELATQAQNTSFRNKASASLGF